MKTFEDVQQLRQAELLDFVLAHMQAGQIIGVDPDDARLWKYLNDQIFVSPMEDPCTKTKFEEKLRQAYQCVMDIHSLVQEGADLNWLRDMLSPREIDVLRASTATK